MGVKQDRSTLLSFGLPQPTVLRRYPVARCPLLAPSRFAVCAQFEGEHGRAVAAGDLPALREAAQQLCKAQGVGPTLLDDRLLEAYARCPGPPVITFRKSVWFEGMPMRKAMCTAGAWGEHAPGSYTPCCCPGRLFYVCSAVLRCAAPWQRRCRR